MPQSSEDSSTTVHGYQSISQPAPLPDTSWLPNTAQAPTWPPLLPTAGTGASSSVLILPFFLFQCPPRLDTPEHTLRPSLTLLLPMLLPPCPWDNRGVQLGLTGWPGVPLTQPDTACPKPPNATTLPSCHSGDSKDSHPRCCQQTLEHSMLHSPGCKVHTALSWGGHCSSPLPAAQSQAHSPAHNLPGQFSTVSCPSQQHQPLQALLNGMFLPSEQPCPAPRAQTSHLSPPCGSRARGPCQPHSGLPCST